LITDGGYLHPKQADKFVRVLQDEATILRKVRYIDMPNPQEDIDKIKIGQRALRVARQTVGQRALTEAERVNPTTSKIRLNTTEFVTEVDIGYEVLEDNIERGALQDTILAMVAQQISLDIEELIVKGDPAAVIPSTTTADDFLRTQRGMLYRANAHIIDAQGVEFDHNLAAQALESLPPKYRSAKLMQFIMSPNKALRYKKIMANRATPLGDAFTRDDIPVRVLGYNGIETINMPDNTIVLTDPMNVIYGVQRKIQFEVEKKPTERVYKFVISMRVATEVEEPDAMVKIINVGA